MTPEEQFASNIANLRDQRFSSSQIPLMFLKSLDIRQGNIYRIGRPT
jgi:hypothetical protein